MTISLKEFFHSKEDGFSLSVHHENIYVDQVVMGNIRERYDLEHGGCRQGKNESKIYLEWNIK